MNKTTIIAIMVIVFLVIGLVIYFFAKSDTDKPTTTTTSTNNGLGYLLQNLNIGSLGSLLNRKSTSGADLPPVPPIKEGY